MKNKLSDLLKRLVRWSTSTILGGLITSAGFLGILAGWIAYAYRSANKSLLTILHTNPANLPPTETAILVVLGLTFLISSVILGLMFQRFLTKRSQIRVVPNYAFLDHAHVAWRYNRFGGGFDYSPYCPIHHIKLLERFIDRKFKNFECVLCKGRPYRFMEYEYSNIIDEVVVLIDAITNNHIRS